jgi:hypothetical protein
VVGNRTRVKVVKNKMAPPFREVEFDILYGQGISHAGDVIDLASEANIVEKSGAWFSFQGERIGQGRENARTYLEQHPGPSCKKQPVLAPGPCARPWGRLFFVCSYGQLADVTAVPVLGMPASTNVSGVELQIQMPHFSCR